MRLDVVTYRLLITNIIKNLIPPYSGLLLLLFQVGWCRPTLSTNDCLTRIKIYCCKLLFVVPCICSCKYFIWIEIRTSASVLWEWRFCAPDFPFNTHFCTLRLQVQGRVIFGRTIINNELSINGSHDFWPSRLSRAWRPAPFYENTTNTEIILTLPTLGTVLIHEFGIPEL